MAREREWFVSCCVLVGLASTPGAPAQEVRVGSEFQVNTYTTDHQSRPSVAADADGDFVVVWQSYDQDGSSYGIFARRFSSAGAPLGQRVPGQHLHHGLPAAPVGGGGRRRRLRRRLAELGQDGIDYGVFARRFSSAGARPGRRVPGQHLHHGDQRYPSVAADADGDFVVAWQSYGQDGADYGVFARRFSSAGAALASEFQVNTYTTSHQRNPSVAADADGDFVVAWDEQRPGRLGLRHLRPPLLERGRSARPPSSRSTPTPRASRPSRRWRRTPTATSSSSGRATARTAARYGVFARRFSSAGAAAGQRVPGQHLHHERPALPVGGGGRRRRLRRRLAEQQPGRLELRRLRAPLLERGRCARPASSRSTPTPRTTSATVGGGGRRRRLRRRLGRARPGRLGLGVFAQRFAAADRSTSTATEFGRPLTDGLLGAALPVRLHAAPRSIAGAVDCAAARAATAPIEAYLAGHRRSTRCRSTPRQRVPGQHLHREPRPTRRWRLTPTATSSSSGRALQDGSIYGVFARRFSSAGAPLASRVPGQHLHRGRQALPVGAAARDGDFVVAWRATARTARLTASSRRRFSSAGAPSAAEFQVNTYTTTPSTPPSVAADADGDFVVAWRAHARMARATASSPAVSRARALR